MSILYTNCILFNCLYIILCHVSDSFSYLKYARDKNMIFEKLFFDLSLTGLETEEIMVLFLSFMVNWPDERGKAGGHEPQLFPLPCHILAFFIFQQPWATAVSPSVPPHLTLPGKTTFLNGIFRAFEGWFLKIQPRHAINIYLDLYISVLICNKDDSS